MAKWTSDFYTQNLPQNFRNVLDITDFAVSSPSRELIVTEHSGIVSRQRNFAPTSSPMDVFLSSQNSLFASSSQNTNAVMDDLFDEFLGERSSPSKSVSQSVIFPDGDSSKVKGPEPVLKEPLISPTRVETPPQDPQPSSHDTAVTPTTLPAQQPQSTATFGQLYDPSTMMNYSAQTGQQFPHYPMPPHMMMMMNHYPEQGYYPPPPEQFYDYGWPQPMMAPHHMNYYPPPYYAGAGPYARPARGRGSRGSMYGPKPRRARGRKAANGGDRPVPGVAAPVAPTPAPYTVPYSVYHEMPEAQSYLNNVHISPKHNFLDINTEGMGTSLEGVNSTDLQSISYSQITPNQAQMMQQQPPKEH